MSGEIQALTQAVLDLQSEVGTLGSQVQASVTALDALEAALQNGIDTGSMAAVAQATVQIASIKSSLAAMGQSLTDAAGRDTVPGA